jgi:hypothetical protein
VRSSEREEELKGTGGECDIRRAAASTPISPFLENHQPFVLNERGRNELSRIFLVTAERR